MVFSFFSSLAFFLFFLSRSSIPSFVRSLPCSHHTFFPSILALLSLSPLPSIPPYTFSLLLPFIFTLTSSSSLPSLLTSLFHPFFLLSLSPLPSYSMFSQAPQTPIIRRTTHYYIVRQGYKILHHLESPIAAFKKRDPPPKKKR